MSPALSTVIHAPADRVFAYVDDPMNLVEWLPSMIEIRNVVGTGAGQQQEWTYKMAGLLLRGQATVVEHVPNKSAVHQTIGMISSDFGYAVEPHEEGSVLTLEVEYSNAPYSLRARHSHEDEMSASWLGHPTARTVGSMVDDFGVRSQCPSL